MRGVQRGTGPNRLMRGVQAIFPKRRGSHSFLRSGLQGDRRGVPRRRSGKGEEKGSGVFSLGFPFPLETKQRHPTPFPFRRGPGLGRLPRYDDRHRPGYVHRLLPVERGPGECRRSVHIFLRLPAVRQQFGPDDDGRRVRASVGVRSGGSYPGHLGHAGVHAAADSSHVFKPGSGASGVSPGPRSDTGASTLGYFGTCFVEYLAPWNNPPAQDHWGWTAGKWAGWAMFVVGSVGAVAVEAAGVGGTVIFGGGAGAAEAVAAEEAVGTVIVETIEVELPPLVERHLLQQMWPQTLRPPLPPAGPPMIEFPWGPPWFLN